MRFPDPISRFREWFAEARAKETADPTAMALATADPAGRPAVRMVLLKNVDARGFVFYTNFNSPKAVDLKANPQAALCFNWPVLGRQVRISGPVTEVGSEEADAYFATRPRLSQIGAWASRQSATMAARFELEQAVAAACVRFPLGRVPRPPFWSGYRVVPETIEFWQQRPFRHHDRECYHRNGEAWRHEWLHP
jgi:pyridoxamine 5'-phosphate oxidase